MEENKYINRLVIKGITSKQKSNGIILKKKNNEKKYN